MKGGKDEEKIMGPLFPRLHINDAEKGGPKAPPRNKMALYEQLSIPTQRFTSGSSNVLPLPHKNMGNLAPSTSSTQHKKSPYSLLGNSTAPHLAERSHPHTSVGTISNTSSKNRPGQLKVTSERDSGNLSIASQISKFQPHNFSIFKSTSAKRVREDDDFRVPGFVRLENTINFVDDLRKKDELGRVKISKYIKSTSDLFPKPISVNILEKRSCFTGDSNRLHQKYDVAQKTKVLEKDLRGDSKYTLERSNLGGSCSKALSRSDDQSHINDYEDQQPVEVEKDVEIRETCNLDSVPGVTISPDAVVEAIGQKQFWKARDAIVRQQKVFAVQVFELHRLIKVQKLFAENPDILMEDKLFTVKPSTEGSGKKLYLENVPEPPPIITPPQKDIPQIPNLISDTNKGLNNLFPNYKPFSATDPIPSPWSFSPPPPGNQWLVPVMSPSEGLIYKPYTGPCSPTTGFPGPMGLSEDYLRFGFFPPYLNPSVSSSAVGPMGPLGKARTNAYPSSFSSYGMKNFIESKESEIHGSTASSPDIRRNENTLSLFPTEPTAQASENKLEKTQTFTNSTRVIKVVPHNAGSASESAARIFRSIQEERRQLE